MTDFLCRGSPCPCLKLYFPSTTKYLGASQSVLWCCPYKPLVFVAYGYIIMSHTVLNYITVLHHFTFCNGQQRWRPSLLVICARSRCWVADQCLVLVWNCQYDPRVHAEHSTSIFFVLPLKTNRLSTKEWPRRIPHLSLMSADDQAAGRADW